MKALTIIATMALVCILAPKINAQDTAIYKLRLGLSILDMPQNKDLPYSYPSMNQALEMSNAFYDVAFWGINKLGNAVIKPDEGPGFTQRSFASHAFKYALGLGFAKYGSELPIPLGVWAHEEFHRSVLAVQGIASKNGNWIGGRWDGTVYGVSDESMAALKSENLPGLLHAYVSGAHAENLSTLTNFQQDFFYRREMYKNALYLYNAHYLYNYLKFSTSEFTDKVKAEAPPHENKSDDLRDFAGADFTAWAYDMFNPDRPYTSRDAFPGGEGVNRRIGFSDLSVEAQEFLKAQKKLSLINFINPAIFFINRIKVSPALSFNVMGQYYPTHFGNAISFSMPLQFRQGKYILGFHKYSNLNMDLQGIELGIMDQPIDKHLFISANIKAWEQPENQSYYDSGSRNGGSLDFMAKLKISNALLINGALSAKTAGWVAGNPYLDKNFSFRVGMNLNIQ